MKVFLAKVRDIAISGILALLPLYVFLIVITKIWKSLNSIGAGIAQMLGMKSILGVAGATRVFWASNRRYLAGNRIASALLVSRLGEQSCRKTTFKIHS